jgi:hypothetical protein
MNETQVVTGRGVRVVQAMAIRKGIEFYARTGMRINRAYTPKNMLLTAANITGESYGTRWTATAYTNAIKGLTKWIDAQHGGQS